MLNKTKNASYDSKLKPLSPTLRTKKRFIRAKIVSDKKFEFKELSESILSQVIMFLGSIEISKSGFWILRDKFNEKNQELVIKVDTRTKEKLIGVLSLIQRIDKTPAKIEIIKVSGTLKGVLKD